MYLSELLQKPILSLYEGELLGNIKQVFFDKTRKKIKIFELISDEEISYSLNPKSIYTIGKHAITIKNKQHLTLSLNENKDSQTPLPFNVKVFTLQGEFLGLVKDYAVNDKFEIENIILDNQQLINICDIASCSNNSVITYYSGEHINIKTFRYRINKSNTDSKVKILPKLFSSFNKIANL